MANLAILKNLVILVFTNGQFWFVVVVDSCEYGDLRKSGESCDSIESCFFLVILVIFN